ncbi:hypothetical protein GW17_00009134 [Ensete ventricosum]|nr:hypothetical protein GW17_00009134 [Ensete ventricosum]
MLILRGTFLYNQFEGAYNLLAYAKGMNKMPTTSLYNIIMAGYFREVSTYFFQNNYGALKVLKQMEDADIKPDSKTFSYLIANCKCEEDIVKASYQAVRIGPPADLYADRPLLGGIAESSAVDFGRKKKNEKKREKNTSHALLFPGSLARFVAHVIHHLRDTSPVGDSSSAGDSFCPRGEKERGNVVALNCMQYRDDMHHSGIEFTKYVYMALINAYAKFGNFEMAKQVIHSNKCTIFSLF